jgi:hypothetical protein
VRRRKVVTAVSLFAIVAFTAPAGVSVAAAETPKARTWTVQAGEETSKELEINNNCITNHMAVINVCGYRESLS